jgi:hypothetical protein
MPVNWDWGNAGKGAAAGAATGAVLGSVIPGAGTAVGAGVGAVAGGVMAGTAFDPDISNKKSGQFRPAAINEGTQVKADQVSSTYQPTAQYQRANYNQSSSYNPNAYTGQFDASGGGQQLTNLERAIGVQGFNGDQYRSAQGAAIDAQTARNTAAARRVNDQAANNSGLGTSGMNRALDQLARSEGDNSALLAKSQLEGQIAGLQQNENQFRTGSALSAAGQQLQNTQFGAGLGEQQSQFGANFQEGKNQFAANFAENQNQFGATFAENQNQFGANQNLAAQTTNAGNNLNAAQLNEGQRQFNEQAKYGASVDQYNYNVLAPQQRKDQRSGALLNAGTSLLGSSIGAAGNIFGASARGPQ